MTLCSRSRSRLCAASPRNRFGQAEGSSTSCANSTARQAASDSSLRQRLQLAHQRIGELEADNQQLRHALAQALGDQRARHARDPLENRP